MLLYCVKSFFYHNFIVIHNYIFKSKYQRDGPVFLGCVYKTKNFFRCCQSRLKLPYRNHKAAYGSLEKGEQTIKLFYWFTCKVRRRSLRIHAASNPEKLRLRLTAAKRTFLFQSGPFSVCLFSCISDLLHHLVIFCQLLHLSICLCSLRSPRPTSDPEVIQLESRAVDQTTVCDVIIFIQRMCKSSRWKHVSLPGDRRHFLHTDVRHSDRAEAVTSYSVNVTSAMWCRWSRIPPMDPIQVE